MKVYLAGPAVFRRDALEYGAKLKALCAEYGLIGIFPLDNEVSDVRFDRPKTIAEKIKELNLAAIRDCDALVADMTMFRGPGMDGGTAYEMGFANALNKIIVGYIERPDYSYIDKVAESFVRTRVIDDELYDEDGYKVENFPPLIDNLMMSANTPIFSTLIDALGFLRDMKNG